MISIKRPRYSHGFGLTEVMIGMVIGLLTILVIMQVMTTFEGQKRTTGGANESQTNGSIALYTIQRMVQTAGFDLPLYSEVFRPLNCNPEPTIDHDGNGATPDIGVYPIFITDGGVAAGASDTITVLSGIVPPAVAAQTGQSMSGLPSMITQLPGGNVIGVDNNLGCQTGDIALTMQSSRIFPNPTCTLKTVGALIGTDQITLNTTAGITVGDGISCLKGWTQLAYSVANDSLMENTSAVVAGIVNLQAQYGISATANSNQIVNWVDATGIWAAPSIDNRKLIKAIRLAVVARSGLLERDNVSQNCASVNTPNPAGVCAWEGTAADPAPTLDLSNNADWQRYRYRVFETVIPLRNVIWGMNTL